MSIFLVCILKKSIFVFSFSLVRFLFPCNEWLEREQAVNYQDFLFYLDQSSYRGDIASFRCCLVPDDKVFFMPCNFHCFTYKVQ